MQQTNQAEQENLQPILFHAHDPMCSWCWGFAQSWQALLTAIKQKHGDKIEIQYLLGGLAPDSDEPMEDAMQQYLQQTWASIQQRIPGTEFNFDFWKDCEPRRSTWPSCRAVIAARKQDQNSHIIMTHAIQTAYYTQAKNPSDDETLIEIAVGLGLDNAQFARDLHSAETRMAHQHEMALVQQLGIQGFPGMVMVVGQQGYNIGVDYSNPERMLEQVEWVMSQ